MGLITKTDVVYDPEHELKTDLYYDDSKPARATIIDIHGGGWFRGDKGKDADWAERLVAGGYAAVVPNYRITPEAYYPAPLEDMATLVAWLKTQDLPQQTAVVGSSAGGNMSVELAIQTGMPAVSLSGILDIDDWLEHHEDVVAAEGDTSSFNSTASAQINQDGHNDSFYKWFVTNYFNGETSEWQAATPVHRISDTTGPLFLANSLNEFVPTSGVLQVAQAMTYHQRPFELMMMIPGTRHAKGYLDDVFNQTMLFLDAHLEK
ncbi:esterase [Secundilactobacillus paracollinoides]|uniref:Esterase n=2 Tax=Secundilactobacillus paracollinoides TaxID=240427 RepID=A0A1B2IUY1_9LACO|nr:esterase [Secundilactobacillus paracollinoides]ANZ62972.1 esterase [Secundilactobacillus paracollinoides]ANZ65865.1 esterase [Secundilactobacillus paracollinoides]KRL76765.1 carboxylic ester hydrolase [Secundilactobacillus paracollinoides DSM 15502 = JCM 11969]